MTWSKSMKPPAILSCRSSAPTMSAPASAASLALGPFAKTARLRLAGAVRHHHRAAHHLVRVTGFPRGGSTTSTDSSNFETLAALHELDGLVRGVLALAIDLLARLDVALRRAWPLRHDLHAHRARGARDDLGRLVDVVRVQVGELLLGDRAHLLVGDRADLACGSARRSPCRCRSPGGSAPRPAASW